MWVNAGGLVDERFKITFKKNVLNVGLFAVDVMF
jgi:hypothetical protein